MTDVSTIARALPEFAASWLGSLAYVYSAEGQRVGARAYRMSYDGEVSSGVIDFTEHGGGHMLGESDLRALFDAKLAGVKWPCDEPGYAPDGWWPDDDGDGWGDEVFECTSYCGECEPTVTITELGMQVAAYLDAQTDSPNQAVAPGHNGGGEKDG